MTRPATLMGEMSCSTVFSALTFDRRLVGHHEIVVVVMNVVKELLVILFLHLNDKSLALRLLLPSDARQHREAHVGIVLDGEDLIALVQNLHAETKEEKLTLPVNVLFLSLAQGHLSEVAVANAKA